MTIEISGQLFYSATEACQKAGISRTTLQRWLRKGVLSKVRRDRRGFRLFTDEDLSAIVAETERISVEETACLAEEQGQGMENDTLHQLAAAGDDP